MGFSKFIGVAVACAALSTAGQARAETAKLTFTTLGTNSGPIPNPKRLESANLVRYGDTAILVDVGDGASQQLVKAGLPIGAPKTVLISHLHFDHTGGLFAFLGQRHQSRNLEPITIFGPRGIKATVDGLRAAMKEGNIVAGTIIGAGMGADDRITVVELGDGDRFQVGPVKVTAATNSHYATFPPGSPAAEIPVSLSYRFDVPGRSVVYTGDTGPSANVETLAKGADLLVSEVMDPSLAIAHIKEQNLNAPAPVLKIVEDHFRREHLSPDEVGRMAERAGVKALVLTHDALRDEEISAAAKTIAIHFRGKMTFAKDLDVF